MYIKFTISIIVRKEYLLSNAPFLVESRVASLGSHELSYVRNMQSLIVMEW